MSQLENHPGGFQHLRRMYTELQEPLNSLAPPLATSPPSPPVPLTGALPNPWAASVAPSTPVATTGLSFPGLMGPGAVGDMRSAIAAMQDPAMRETVRHLMADPSFFDQVLHT